MGSATAASAGGPSHAPSHAPSHGSPGRGDAPRAVGLVDGTRLVTFSTARAGAVRTTGPLEGLTGDAELVGIDARVQDGQVYGVGDRGGVYRLDVHAATATEVLRLTVPLQGSAFGVDFNPVANALRIVSDSGQNLRQSFAGTDAGYPATVADTPLTTPPAVGTTTGVTAAGYTNDDTDPATATTLFVIGTGDDVVAVQSPANSGTLAPTGKLGVDVSGSVGFDVTGTTGHLVVPSGGGSVLYRVSLLTGAATEVGTLDAEVTDLALRLS
nr:DUF4394 domain-containing protein [Kineococcus aurantiacus]